MSRLMLLVLMACSDAPESKSTEVPEDTDTPPVPDSPNPNTDDTAGDSGGVSTPIGCLNDDTRALDGPTCIAQAACVWDGTQSSAYSGFALAAGLDFDGDGWEDIVIGAPLHDIQTMTSGLLADAGTAQLISGGGIGAEDMGIRGHLGGRDDGDLLGTAVTLIPDMNGDGLAEIAAGARGSGASGESYAGEVALLLGQADPFEEDSDSGTLNATSRWLGERAYSRAGKALTGGIDTDGDGLGELWIAGELKQISTGSSYEYNDRGRVYRIAGRTEGWPAEASLADADASLDGTESMGGAGLALAANADLDGDGHGDLVIGAPHATSNRGVVYLLSGGPEALSGSHSLGDVPVQITGEFAGDTFGWTVAVGDVTGDDQPDLIVGAPMSDSSTPDAGMVSIYAGGPGILTDGPTLQTRIAGEFDDHQLGTGLSAGRDLTGDGQDDLLIGAVNAWQGLITKGGRLYVLEGGSSMTEMMSARTIETQIYGRQVKEYLGRSTGMADIDGDGRTDLLVGSGYSHTDSGNYSGRLYLFFGD